MFFFFFYINLKNLNLENQSHVIQGVLPKSLSHISKRFNLIFMDPPYEEGLENQVLSSDYFLQILTLDALIIVEQSKHSDMVISDAYKLERSHRVGDTMLNFIRLSA